MGFNPTGGAAAGTAVIGTDGDLDTERDGAFGGIVEAGDQVDERRLVRAALPHRATTSPGVSARNGETIVPGAVDPGGRERLLDGEADLGCCERFRQWAALFTVR